MRLPSMLFWAIILADIFGGHEAHCTCDDFDTYDYYDDYDDYDDFDDFDDSDCFDYCSDITEFYALDVFNY